MTLADGLCWILAVVLLLHGVGNAAGVEFARKAFESFGYPRWLMVAVGCVELVAAALLLYPPLRWLAAVLAGLCLIGAVTTLLRQRAWRAAEYPAVLLVLTVLIGLDLGGLA